MTHGEDHGNRGKIYGKGKSAVTPYFQAGFDLLFP